MSMVRALPLSMALVVLAACVGSEPTGIMPTRPGSGPMVRFDLTAKPLPDVPMPNNTATRMDPTSPTGRRINISMIADTRAESKLRAKADQLDGFGVFSPITVSFDAPLDLQNIRTRQAQNADFSDDAFLLVDVDRSSPEFGSAMRLDVGQGNYPLGLEWPGQYWDNDEHADSPNLVFETHDEDINGNGVMDPYEDIDFDGVLDKPNTFSGKVPPLITPENFRDWLDRKDRPIDDLVTFYEKQTNTLVLWPVKPLRQGTTYAMVLTRNLTGLDGEPVQSPFPYVNHSSQTPDLEPLAEVLAGPGIGMSLDDVTFAWTFTTQTITADLEAVRAGLYGHGPLAELKDEYPPSLVPKQVIDEDQIPSFANSLYYLPTEKALPIFDMAGPLLGYPDSVAQGLAHDTSYTDYWVLGSFTSPSFLVDRDGIATPMYPADDNESWDIDIKTGKSVHGPSRVTFLCSIPKETAQYKPPFPVMIYGHGFSGAPFEIFGFAGRFARFGYALCGLDAVGHGLALPSDEDIPYDELVPTFLEPLGLLKFFNAFRDARLRDLDNDGALTSNDIGGDFWSWDMFHLRDNLRQSVVDHMNFIRNMRSLGKVKWGYDTNHNGKDDDLMGDWNGDGIPDMGGPDNQFYPTWGQSMGAFNAQILAAVEPTANPTTAISGGGGLIHVGIKSTNPGVPEGALMPLMGPFVQFSPLGDDQDTVEIAIMINDLHREYRDGPRGSPHYYPVARTTSISPGDRVIVRNLTNGKEIKAFRHPDGRGFRVSIAADALSAVEKRPLLGLHDGDTQPVPVSCEPGTWTVPKDDDGVPTGPAHCEGGDLERSLLFGDHLQIEVHFGWDGPVKAVFDRFQIPVTFQGAIFPEGAPLVALGTGLGRARNTPDFRKLMGVAAIIIEKGDPIAYARHYRKEDRLDFSYDSVDSPQANAIIYHTVGDPNVTVAGSLALARAAGILDPEKNQRLIEAHVTEGVEGFWRYLSSTLTVQDWNDPAHEKLVKDMRWPDEWNGYLGIEPPTPLSLHFDPDDLDDGTNEFGEP
ncbi:MAG: hypothetical protein GXP54_07825, partial [Deltaproteobacteria bacterium]|nr:hypothetical protein [Deltaproteobacteria bacterium]